MKMSILVLPIAVRDCVIMAFVITMLLAMKRSLIRLMTVVWSIVPDIAEIMIVTFDAPLKRKHFVAAYQQTAATATGVATPIMNVVGLLCINGKGLRLLPNAAMRVMNVIDRIFVMVPALLGVIIAAQCNVLRRTKALPFRPVATVLRNAQVSTAVTLRKNFLGKIFL